MVKINRKETPQWKNVSPAGSMTSLSGGLRGNAYASP